jgi:nitrate/TMAO reductase-like tetraheme cytochrome c subunit
LSIAGALLTTGAAAIFIALIIAALFGMLTNPYAGVVVFVLIPAVFVLGLLQIPAGIWLQRRKLRRDPTAPVEWPVLDFGRRRVRRGALLFTALSAVNIVILLVAGYGGLHWMESPSFCGQTCHTPMRPQHSAWQAASHARIACVQCHVGEGAAGFVHAKMSGVRQLVEVATNSYPRPVPPGAHMPPGAQALTCTGCHQPTRATGDLIRVLREYADDEGNSETTTVLQMHMGRGSATGKAIHWHADPAVNVEYVATDEGRQTIPYVKVTYPDGKEKEFVAADTTDQMIRDGVRRSMDCTDCHNTVGHPIAPTPEKGIDSVIAAGLVSRELPFVRREAIRMLKESYSTQEEGAAAIDRGVRSLYPSHSGGIEPREVDRTVAALQDLYRRNVFPAMKVQWGTYPNNRGHVTSMGCFRCHDESHTASDQSTISGDCGLCHTQLESPF